MHGNNPTGMELLSSKLKQYYPIISVSDKKNKIARMIHIIITVISHSGRTKVILIDTYSTLNFYFAITSAVLAILLQTKYVLILRGGDLPRRLKQNPRLCRFLLTKSYQNISPSGYILDVFQTAGYDVKFIPNAMDISKYPYSVRQLETPNLLYVRSFHKIYNPTMAIRVLKKLLENYPGASLCMVGPDKDGTRQAVKSLVDHLGISGKVSFTGYISKQEIIKLSKRYNVFINTTNFDNMPVSVMEAMALGLPVVSTDAGGMPFLIDNFKSGLLVNKDDTASMVEAIQRLIEDPELTESLVQNARTKIEGYDWSKVLPLWQKLFDELI